MTPPHFLFSTPSKILFRGYKGVFPFRRVYLKSAASSERGKRGCRENHFAPCCLSPAKRVPSKQKLSLTEGWASVQEIGGHFTFAFDLDDPTALQLITFGCQYLIKISGHLEKADRGKKNKESVWTQAGGLKVPTL